MYRVKNVSVGDEKLSGFVGDFVVGFFMGAEEDFCKQACDVYSHKEEAYAKECDFQPLAAMDAA